MNNWDTGLYATGENMVIEENLILNNSRGINIEYSYSPIIRNNQIVKNKDNGLELGWSSSSASIQNNTIVNNTRNGIMIDSENSGCIISGNQIIHNWEDGIQVNYGANYNTILNNIIQKNGGFGILLNSVNYSQITDNWISQNKKYGGMFDSAIILLDSHFNEISNNFIFQNYYLGISFFDSSQNTFSQNLVQDHLHGLYLSENSDENTISRNHFLNNSLYIEKCQAYDNGSFNIFVFNNWDDWNAPDEDSDGFVDNPYLINGSAMNQDPYPRVSSTSALSIRLYGLRVKWPNGGETLTGYVYIVWAVAICSLDVPVSYSVYYSNNGGKTWSFIKRVFYGYENMRGWDTTETWDDDLYLIKVVAETADGMVIEDISDHSFRLRNGIIKPKPPTPVEFRVFLLLVILGTLFFVTARLKK